MVKDIEDKAKINKNNKNDYTNNSLSKKQTNQFFGYGGRKTSRAYAYIKPGSGVITINNKPIHKYYNSICYRRKMMIPLMLTKTSAILDVNLFIIGGGTSGQLDASIPALSRALIKMNPAFTTILAKSKIFILFLRCMFKTRS